jgi:hypothetical protein
MNADPTDVLPEQVREELLALDARLSSRRRQSLPELLRAWSRYAELLSSRTPLDPDDYRAMLFARDAIEDLVGRATPTTRQILEALVGHSDSLFLFGTREDHDGAVQGRSHEDRPGWWWSRAPLKPG